MWQQYPPYYGPPQGPINPPTMADQIRVIEDNIQAMERFKKALKGEDKKPDEKILSLTEKQWRGTFWCLFPLIWITTNMLFVSYMINLLTAMKVLAK